jgi:cytochrome b561
MILWDILSALFIGILFTVIFIIGYGKERGWGYFFAALFIIFLTVWAGGIWTSKFFIYSQGKYWLPILSIGLFIILVLTAIIPSRLEKQHPQPGPSEIGMKKRLNHLRFWTVAIFLIIAIISGYALLSENESTNKWKTPQNLNAPDTLKR